MKKSLILVLAFFISFLMKLNAQQVGEGVYLSANDFQQGKVTYVNDHQQKYKLCLHNAFQGSTVKITMGSSVVTLKKESIFGYRDKQNSSYRFIHNVAYKIINPTERILLYSQIVTEGGHRSSRQVTRYYFSASADAPVYDLSKWNLKTVLHDDLAFHKLLDVYFHSDDELIAYDTTRKIYEINQVYDLSKQ